MSQGKWCYACRCKINAGTNAEARQMKGSVLIRVGESRSMLRVLKRVFRRPRSARQLGKRNPNDIKAGGCTVTTYNYIKD